MCYNEDVPCVILVDNEPTTMDSVASEEEADRRKLAGYSVQFQIQDLSFPSPVQTGIPSSICLMTWTFRRGCFVALTPTVLRSQARFSSEAFALC